MTRNNHPGFKRASARQRLKAVLLSLGALGGAWFGFEPTAQAYVAGNLDAKGLYAQTKTLAARTQTTWETAGCSSSEDTVMFAVSGTVGATGARTTLAVNDNKTSSNTCSKVTVLNGGTTAMSYTLVIANKETGLATVSLLHDGVTDTASLQVGGHIVNATVPTGAKIFRTVPRRASTSGGGQIDPHLFVINPTLGGEGSFDDDSGVAGMSLINRSTLTGTSYWIAIGKSSGAADRLGLWVQKASPTDSDGDGIADEDEFTLDTDPQSPDSDGDGLTDPVEYMGVPASNLAGLDSSLILPWQGGTGDTSPGSNPLIPDVFVEADYLVRTGASAHTHNPGATGGWTTYQSDLEATFINPSWTGQTIHTHFELGNQITEFTAGGTDNRVMTFESTCTSASGLAETLNAVPKQFTTLRSANFDNARRSSYHYVIFGHFYKATPTGAAACTDTTSSGLAETFGFDVMVTLGGFTADVGSSNEQRGGFVHEIGHNFGLGHNNNDGPGASCIHGSVMNYGYTMSGTGLGNNLNYSYSTGVALLKEDCGLTGTDLVNGLRCVRVGDPSPKNKNATIDCTPTVGVGEASCDCDIDEWDSLVLAGTGGSWASGLPAGTPFEAVEAARADFVGELRAARPRYTEAHRRILAARRQRLRDMNAHDVIYDPVTERSYQQ